MKHFGFTVRRRGQDRGGRVAHRMALDHPAAVTKLVLIDIVPTYYLYTHVTIGFVQAYHWFTLCRPRRSVENHCSRYRLRFVSAATRVPAQERNAGRRTRCVRTIRAASIDLEHDKADLDKKIACP